MSSFFLQFIDLGRRGKVSNIGVTHVHFQLAFILCQCMLNPFLSVLYTSRYVMRTKYLEKSKLKTVPIHLDGIRSQVMFTSWTSNLLTLSFAINGIITLLSETSDKNTIFHLIFHHKLMLRFAVIIFEICAPTSMLVKRVFIFR